jgi:glycosyltransferase involved in cell wall biosynthesis
VARIAINTRFLLPDKLEGFGWFTHEVVSRMVRQHPEHEFIFMFDRDFDKRYVYADNVIPVIVGPPARHPILFQIWFEISVKKALKKHQADLFFSPDGYLSLASDVPQVPVIHDLNFEHYPKDLPPAARKYLRKWFPKFARKAEHILTVSEYSRHDIAKTYGVPEDRITVAWNGVNDAYRSLTADEKENTRQELTGGIPYLIFVGSLHPRKNVIRMLQGWDAYRNAGGTRSMVIAGSAYWWNKEMDAAFKALAHGPEVIFTGHLPIDRLTKAVGAAEALVFVSYFEGFGIPAAEAMRCGVPVIAANATSLPEVCGDAALYCDPFDVPSITQQMQALEQDPARAAELGKKGLKRSELFSWDHTAEKCWRVIEQVLSKKTA